MSLIAVLFCLLLPASARAAASNNGITAAPVLQIPMGSRAYAMGGAFTGVADDVSALYYNPAGLSLLAAQEVSATFIQGLVDSSLQQVAYGNPIPFSGITDHGYSTLAGSVLYSQDGTIQENRTNPDGSFLSSQNLTAGTDLVASVGYSERVLESNSGFQEGPTVNHFLGVSGKFIHSTLAQQYSADAVTVDAGYLADCPDLGLRFGFSALNIVGSLKYISATDPLPATLRAGASYRRALGSDYILTLAADGQYLVNERQPLADAGVEFVFFKTVALRGGYQFLQGSLGLTAGVGVFIRKEFSLDYAWSLATTAGLGDAQRISLSYRFGPVNPKLRASQRASPLELNPEEEPARNLNEQNIKLDNAPNVTPASPKSTPATGIPGWVY